MEGSAHQGLSPFEKSTSTRFSELHHQIQVLDAGNAQKNRLLPSLGLHNNRHMLLCSVKAFLDYYGPCQVNQAALNTSISEIFVEANPIIVRDEHDCYVWKDFQAFSTSRGIPGSKMFGPLKRIVQSVMKEKQNGLRLTHALSLCSTSKFMASTHEIDACFIEGVNIGPALHCVKTNTPQETDRLNTKLSRMALSRSHAQLQVLSACHEILSQDPRRMWIYSLMFENSLVSMWYFSRSHSVKSVTFDWVQNPALLIRVLLMFANATQYQLGIDSTVHLGPRMNNSMTWSYVYEVPAAQGKCLFFKTLRSLTSEPPACIAGRTTRVWEATQVTTADGTTEVNGKRVVLKDVWLEADNEPVRTEVDNMEALFQDVDNFVEAGLEREINDEIRENPHVLREALLSDTKAMERLMAQFIDNEERFHAFDNAAKKRLRENLTNKKYRSMFLTKLHAYRGVKCRPVGPRARLFPRMFFSWPFGPDAVDALLEEEQWARGETKDAQDNRNTPGGSPLFAPRQQYRFIYEEVCTTLRDLDTVGSVVDVLSQTIDVLHIFFAAGWVHRDISVTNIMAYRPTRGHPWTTRLADLEFARPIMDNSLQNLRVGTPFFMPVEISSQLHLFTCHLRRRPKKGATLADDLCVRKEDNPEAYDHLSHISRLPFCPPIGELPPNPLWCRVAQPTSPVFHDFQHDLESIWWILLWIITCRVGCEKSANAVVRYFKCDMNDCVARVQLLSTTILALENALDENMHDFRALMELLRRELLQNYIARAIFGHVSLPESYSSIHATFATKFRQIQQKCGSWQNMKLQRNESGLEDITEMAASSNHSTLTGKHDCESSGSNTVCAANKQLRLDSVD